MNTWTTIIVYGLWIQDFFFFFRNGYPLGQRFNFWVLVTNVLKTIVNEVFNAIIL